jgi:hypothetical protein
MYGSGLMFGPAGHTDTGQRWTAAAPASLVHGLEG